ncbi:fimbrial protein [Trabulsiella odontotermitis]|uniref:fimbrial protein n=1 Tax=Trabulsiella odontotermitis TaxID=379893 RepID=UPI00067604C2|nr:fimbrial protein [Trabulsiella odontotermitis]KNC87950.1 fimbrial protein [Trabulsiella odontotermitis]
MCVTQKITRAGLVLFTLLAAALPLKSFALSCKEAGTNSVKQVITLDKPIVVSTSSLTAGTLLWRSQTFSSTFKCEDTDGYPRGEDAYLYWDPTTLMQSIHKSLEVGVTYHSVDYKPSPSAKTLVGPGTTCRPDGRGGCTVYIKATGQQPPQNGQITDNSQYALFQVDGVGGLNNRPNSNFRAYIAGLGNIHFISCNPQITVVANNGTLVNFGKIPARNAVTGKIEKQVPFSVQANLTGAGQDCQGQTLIASFSTTYPTQDTTTILPTTNSGFGILISPADNPTGWIPLKTPVPLGYVNGSVISTNFLASLKWLSTTPKEGTFNASANIDVTFK